MAGELGGRALRDHAREGLARIELAVRVLQVGQRSLEVEVAGGQNPARHRRQVGHERDSWLPTPWGAPPRSGGEGRTEHPIDARKFLNHLWHVAVTFDCIRAERLVDLAEMDAHRRRSPRPAHVRAALEAQAPPSPAAPGPDDPAGTTSGTGSDL